MTKARTLDEIVPQKENANAHTERGMRELEYSLSQHGWFGAITAAADGEVFDGSARRELLETAQLDEAIFVEIDGTRPVVLLRTDIPTADDPRAQEMAIAANKIAADNLNWDAAVLAGVAARVDLSAYVRDDELALVIERAQDMLSGEGAAADVPFADFAPVAVDDTHVAFAFGDFRGRVARSVYDSFVAAYRKVQSTTSSSSPVRWRISAAWASKQLDCTIAGIARGCHGRCCRSMSFWPPRVGVNPDGCDYLGEHGCSLAPDDKPVICHLFPLMPNKSGTLVAYNRMPQPNSCCKPNYGKGPMLIEAIRPNLIHLFGVETADYIVSEVAAGRDPEFDVPAHIAAALEWEEAWAASDTMPERRSVQWERYKQEHGGAAQAERAQRPIMLGDVLREWLNV